MLEIPFTVWCLLFIIFVQQTNEIRLPMLKPHESVHIKAKNQNLFDYLIKWHGFRATI